MCTKYSGKRIKMGIQDQKVRSFVQNNKKMKFGWQFFEIFFSEVDYLVGYGGEREESRAARQRWWGGWKRPLEETEESEK